MTLKVPLVISAFVGRGPTKFPAISKIELAPCLEFKISKSNELNKAKRSIVVIKGLELVG